MDSRLRFRALDGWRGVCAVLVALFHLPVKSTITGLPFFTNAWLFVDFFFVLSGFVIAHAYGGRVADASDAAVFAVKRIGRLWPLHVAVLACMVAMEFARFTLLGWYGAVNRAPFTGGSSIPLIVQNLFLVQAVRPEPMMSWNAPSWSISVEFWAYVLFAIVALASARRAAALKAIIAIGAGVVVWRCSNDGMDVVAWLGFFRCFFGFFTGQLLYQLFARPRSLAWQRRWSAGGATILELFGIACVVAFVSLVHRSDASIAAPLLFAAVIYVFAPERGAVSRLMRTRVFDRLGRFSYSIYMVHMLVIAASLAVIRLTERIAHVRMMTVEVDGSGSPVTLIDFGGEVAMLCLAVAILGAVVTVSAATWRWIEQPGQAFFNRLARRIAVPRGAKAHGETASAS
jgi:peptidoglycan/LPS O-acetylase OafA/YrhL